MTEPLYLVTSAAGKTGGAVVRLLRERNLRVRAAVHRLDARSAALQALGAQIVVADAFDPGAVGRALEGVQRAYYCPPWHPHMLQAATVFALAAHQHRVEAIVGLSQWLASPDHPSLATRQNWIVDQLFELLPNARHVTIAPGFFADNYLTLIGFAAQLGLFPMPMGGGRNAPPSNEDIARVAVAALVDPERHAGKTYRPTGPVLLCASDMARILGSVLGRRVRHVEMPMWMFRKALRVLGPRFSVDSFQQTGLRYYLEEHALGAFEWGAPTDHVKRITGMEPEDFGTIASRYAAQPHVRRSTSNFLQAAVDFMRIGVTPGLNLDNVESAQRHPVVQQPILAVRSAQWRNVREAQLETHHRV